MGITVPSGGQSTPDINDLNDLNDIHVFAEVVRQGSFAGAARALRMPRSTVSRRVAKLEQSLGARLLQRTTRSLHLTEVGETYHRYADNIVAQVQEARHAVEGLQAAPQGMLRVAAPVSFEFLGSAVSSYMHRYPLVEIEVVCSERVVDLVQERFDVAIRAGRLSDSTFVARKLGTLHNVLVASPAFVEDHGQPSQPQDLSGFACLAFSGGSMFKTWTLCGERTVEVKVRPRFRANDMEMLRRSALDGLGIAMMPTLHCVGDLQQGSLIQVLPNWRSPQVKVHAVYPSTNQLSPKLKTFLDHVHEYLRSHSIGEE